MKKVGAMSMVGLLLLVSACDESIAVEEIRWTPAAEQRPGAVEFRFDWGEEWQAEVIERVQHARPRGVDRYRLTYSISTAPAKKPNQLLIKTEDLRHQGDERIFPLDRMDPTLRVRRSGTWLYTAFDPMAAFAWMFTKQSRTESYTDKLFLRAELPSRRWQAWVSPWAGRRLKVWEKWTATRTVGFAPRYIKNHGYVAKPVGHVRLTAVLGGREAMSLGPLGMEVRVEIVTDPRTLRPHWVRQRTYLVDRHGDRRLASLRTYEFQWRKKR